MTIFAPVQHALDFLAEHPHIEMFELFILDLNGVPRGKLLHREELLAVYQSGRPLPSTLLGLTLNGDDVENRPWSVRPGPARHSAPASWVCTWRSSARSTGNSWPKWASRTGGGT